MVVAEVGIVLFDGFEPLDVFGPVEVLGDVSELRLRYISAAGGTVTCRQGVRVETEPFAAFSSTDNWIFVPGGMGTRALVEDPDWLLSFATLLKDRRGLLTVCTGSALAARVGALDGRRATSNKNAFKWVCSISDKVNWLPCARWTVDGNTYTASGVAAGIDMALAFVSERFGTDCACKTARRMEYVPITDQAQDPFAVECFKSDK